MAAACWAMSAVAASHPHDNLETTLREVVLTPSVPIADEAVRLTIVQVFFPGVPDRFACRMQVRALNQSGNHINVRTLLNTFDETKESVDSWLVPTGDLAPGQEVLRTYSCRQASAVEVSRETPYGWPGTCAVDGVDISPCPVILHVSSTLELPKE